MSGPDERQVQRTDSSASANGTYAPWEGSQSHGAAGGNSSGIATISGSTLILSGAEIVGSAIRLEGGGQFELAAGRLNIGTFEGTLVQGGGTLEAGGRDSGATLIAGDYVLREGSLEVKLQGVPSDDEYAHLAVDGSFDNREGGLDIVLGFKPDEGEVFTILKTSEDGSVKGTFSGLTEGTTFYASFEDEIVPFSISYRNTDITLKAVPISETDVGRPFPASGEFVALSSETKEPSTGGGQEDESGKKPSTGGEPKGGSGDEFALDTGPAYVRIDEDLFDYGASSGGNVALALTSFTLFVSAISIAGEEGAATDDSDSSDQDASDEDATPLTVSLIGLSLDALDGGDGDLG